MLRQEEHKRQASLGYIEEMSSRAYAQPHALLVTPNCLFSELGAGRVDEATHWDSVCQEDPNPPSEAVRPRCMTC